MEPTLAGFQSFLTSAVGIPSGALAASSPTIVMAFNIAMVTVARPLEVFCFTDASGQQSSLFALAVYNLATANLFFYAQDQDGVNYFAEARAKWNLLGYIGGTIQSTGDQGTSQSMVVPEAAETFTLEDLQLIKTPWGRAYLQLAQKLGPSLFGIT